MEHLPGKNPNLPEWVCHESACAIRRHPQKKQALRTTLNESAKKWYSEKLSEAEKRLVKFSEQAEPIDVDKRATASDVADCQISAF